jgi:hypothetical protein
VTGGTGDLADRGISGGPLVTVGDQHSSLLSVRVRCLGGRVDGEPCPARPEPGGRKDHERQVEGRRGSGHQARGGSWPGSVLGPWLGRDVEPFMRCLLRVRPGDGGVTAARSIGRSRTAHSHGDNNVDVLSVTPAAQRACPRDDGAV